MRSSSTSPPQAAPRRSRYTRPFPCSFRRRLLRFPSIDTSANLASAVDRRRRCCSPRLLRSWLLSSSIETGLTTRGSSPGLQTTRADAGQRLTGVWRNADTNNGADSLISRGLTAPARASNVEPIGLCPRGRAVGGLHTVVLQDGQATGVWTPRNTPVEVTQHRTVTLTLRPDDGRLSVRVINTWSPDASPSRAPSAISVSLRARAVRPNSSRPAICRSAPVARSTSCSLAT